MGAPFEIVFVGYNKKNNRNAIIYPFDSSYSVFKNRC